MLHTAASCSLSVTSSINGRRLAAVRAAFAVVVTACSSLQVRVQLGKRAIAAVLVLGVRGVVYDYVLRLVLGFQPHRSGLKESKICVRNQRFKGSIGSKSPLRGGRKKVEKKHFSLCDFRIWSRVVGSPKFSGQDVLP